MWEKCDADIDLARRYVHTRTYTVSHVRGLQCMQGNALTILKANSQK